MRATAIGLFLGAILFAGSASAYDAEDPRNCTGPDWNDATALVVSKVTASPRVNFVKSPYDDDFKADACPAAIAACEKKSYLVTGDLVLVGATRDSFTCVSFHAPSSKKQNWTSGWLPSSALTPVAPMSSPAISDWQGTWTQPGGTIEIRRGGLGGRLHIEGEMIVPGARDVHTGVIEAEVNPTNNTIAFLDDGWLPFETKCDSGCRVRMQRVGQWLVVEDNLGCGGAGVSFTGLYRRK